MRKNTQIEKFCINCGKSFKIIQVRKAAKFCSRKCMGENWKGKNSPIYKKQKCICKYCNKEFELCPAAINKGQGKYCSKKCLYQGRDFIGKNNPNWKGINNITNNIRTSNEYYEWRNSIYKRDYFTCQLCGDNTGHNLNVHHIIELNKIIKNNNIKFIGEALKCNILWNINNGITLCKKCHQKQHKHRI